jgi:hypothetical protein
LRKRPFFVTERKKTFVRYMQWDRKVSTKKPTKNEHKKNFHQLRKKCWAEMSWKNVRSWWNPLIRTTPLYKNMDPNPLVKNMEIWGWWADVIWTWICINFVKKQTQPNIHDEISIPERTLIRIEKYSRIYSKLTASFYSRIICPYAKHLFSNRMEKSKELANGSQKPQKILKKE